MRDKYGVNKKIITVVLIITSLFVFTSCEETVAHITRTDWSPDVKAAINSFLDDAGVSKEDEYAVFDFDNTSAIFDVEEQLAIYQLQHMAFAMSPIKLHEVLLTQLSNPDEDLSLLGYGKGSYNDWASDITAAYQDLFSRYDINPKGLDEEDLLEIQSDPVWQEFATKMRAMYDLIFDNESADVAYPWITYWFTGMSEQEVYELAFASHKYFAAIETSKVTWNSPESIDSLVGPVSYTWIAGVQITENIKELMKALNKNGIDVWVCSASSQDVIRAAIDAWDLHDDVTGLLGMVNKSENGAYINEYNYDGCGWLSGANGKWERDAEPEGSQTQGAGKVTAISNVLCKRYGHGPCAGFMDSTGDFNFCTEYESLRLVVCFNRADRKVTDGGGLIAELAIYQRDCLGYDYQEAKKNNDTLYVLQGRDENGLRSFRAGNASIKVGKTEEALLRNTDNELELQYFIDNRLSTKDIIDRFCIVTPADDPNNPICIEYGFLKEYPGYHSRP